MVPHLGRGNPFARVWASIEWDPSSYDLAPVLRYYAPSDLQNRLEVKKAEGTP